MESTERHLLKKKLHLAIRRYYSNKSKSEKTGLLVGVNQKTFINYINQNLINEMTPDNFGKIWGFDHIVPTELFDLSNQEEKKICYNYLNIMPMFTNDNRIKGCSIHFSLLKINKMIGSDKFNSNELKTLNYLKEKCELEIKERYDKYL